jgi:hypothetical protein
VTDHIYLPLCREPPRPCVIWITLKLQALMVRWSLP